MQGGVRTDRGRQGPEARGPTEDYTSALGGLPRGEWRFLPSLVLSRDLLFNHARRSTEQAPPLETRSRYTLLGGAGVDGGTHVPLAWRVAPAHASSGRMRDCLRSQVARGDSRDTTRRVTSD